MGQINVYSLTEKQKLEKAILAVQETSDKMREIAKQEASLIVEEAKNNANSIVHEALVRAERLEHDSMILEKNMKAYKILYFSCFISALVKAPLSIFFIHNTSFS